eukprot:CAMPEP_0114991244 /NCGR_PEP_ID=MMETSP0216-20121206/11256_1 /TAXON_ID=223996 /ORGANISM="Protocruzia adherens, Strain Boccale" /LENGTH=188 /DNA_ID=CAMNT_0002354533 /DNA_START=28 /DNA_END=594 /DNA_ORIENTATION=-
MEEVATATSHTGMNPELSEQVIDHIFEGSIDPFRTLIENNSIGYDAEIDQKGLKMENMAAAFGQVGVLQTLKEEGIDLNGRPYDESNPSDDQWDGTPLMWAAKSGQLEAVKYLIAIDCDMFIKNRAGGMAYDEAIEFEQTEVRDYLKIHMERKLVFKERSGMLFLRKANHLSVDHYPTGLFREIVEYL